MRIRLRSRGPDRAPCDGCRSLPNGTRACHHRRYGVGDFRRQFERPERFFQPCETLPQNATNLDASDGPIALSRYSGTMSKNRPCVETSRQVPTLMPFLHIHRQPRYPSHVRRRKPLQSRRFRASRVLRRPQLRSIQHRLDRYVPRRNRPQRTTRQGAPGYRRLRNGVSESSSQSSACRWPYSDCGSRARFPA